MNLKSPDLTQHPPRSPRVRLGGFAILPRMLDKCRATIAGKHGEYHYNCPTDQHFLNFVGIDADALKKEVATGKGDWEILEWINAKAKHKRTESEIHVWSAYCDQRVPNNPDGRDYLNGEHKKLAAQRTDIVTWFDLLDLDDYVSYGGKA